MLNDLLSARGLDQRRPCSVEAWWIKPWRSRAAADELTDFTFVQRTEHRWSEQITRADYLGRWLTISTFLSADEATRARMLAQLNSILDADPTTRGREIFTLPMMTEVFVCRARTH